MLLSELTYEAIVTEVLYDEGHCTVIPLNPSLNSSITRVPIPHQAGIGGAGIFTGLRKGSKVIVTITSGRGKESNVIISTLPDDAFFLDNFDNNKPADSLTGYYSYPKMADGRIIIQGELGSRISALENGDVNINTIGGRGIYVTRNKTKSSISIISEDLSEYTNSGKTILGPVRRISGIQRNIFPKPDTNEAPIFADPTYALIAPALGFFTDSPSLKTSLVGRKRNPEISEYRNVINEFSSDSMFTGFDDEYLRTTGDIKLNSKVNTLERNREQGNVLHLAPNELIEIIGGNLVDINGDILDINYRKLNYGNNNKVPYSINELEYESARKISRRGVGYHFQLSTNSKKSDESNSINNFIFDIDKEGLLKINIPVSSDSGNIPFVSATNFIANNGNDLETTYTNLTKKEPIPVTLRDENGKIVYPSKIMIPLERLASDLVIILEPHISHQ